MRLHGNKYLGLNIGLIKGYRGLFNKNGKDIENYYQGLGLLANKRRSGPLEYFVGPCGYQWSGNLLIKGCNNLSRVDCGTTLGTLCGPPRGLPRDLEPQ